MERDKVLDKVRKLMAKANDPCNVHEAAAAAEAAQRLMMMHKIEESDLTAQAGDEDPITDIDLLADSKQLSPTSWQQILLGAVARSCFCRLIVGKGGPGMKGKLHVFGRQSDLEAVTWLYHALTDQINALCDAWGRLNEVTRRDRNAFRYGAAVTIHNRLVQARQSQELEVAAGHGSTALVPLRKAEAAVDTHVAERFRNLRTITHQGPSSWAGYAAGRHAGEHVALNRVRGALA